MVRSRLLAATLLGLAAAPLSVRAIHVGTSIGRVQDSGDPEPFDPARDGILIYSMGKTASSSLQCAAGNIMKPPCGVTDGDINWGKQDMGVGVKGPSLHRAIKCHGSECALNFIKSRPEGSRTWVISSNRNVFSRAPSAMFQNVARWTEEQIKNVSMSDLFSFFHDGAGEMKYHIHGLPQTAMTWYTRSFKTPLGLDIWAHQFDFDNKFLRVRHVFHNRTLEVLFLRMEDSTQWETILKPFFPDVKMSVQNTVASKESGALASKYKEFLSTMQYTEKEIDTLSKSEDFSFFYSREEKEAFILKAREQSKRLSQIHAEDLNLFFTGCRDAEDKMPVC